ncbi:hypothetical protein Vadar_030996 [Vaccinium darrowii]|uniref:Uncharacterized protein n=1 Tax=Vaccinium darrowii TaxID=229202 RepID=A0ACB7YAA7_9ERIC|nr:hypothetical protein Vadar_030996 [Vaccinium darrowii]
MEIKNWRRNFGTRSTRLGRGYYQLQAAAETSAAATTGGGSRWRPVWKFLWRKLLKEKRKMMIEYSSNSVHLKGGVPNYDEYTYSQNFDKGLVWDEPDSLSKSFSVRFADPTRIFIFKKKEIM